MAIVDVDRLTIYHWFDTWETSHFAGLYDHKKCGRPPKLTIEEQTQVQQYKVVHLLAQETSKRVSPQTRKRLLKKIVMSGNALSVHQRKPQSLSSTSGAKR
jgi:hypothetical protein